MIKLLYTLVLVAGTNRMTAQPNCNAYLYRGDTLQYKACKLIEAVEDYQFTRAFQEKHDEALRICPYFAWGYREKSVAYLKSGDFVTWKKLIDQAVHYDTAANLSYRAWCRFQFFRDYTGAIRDIEMLEKIRTTDIWYGINDAYHLVVTKAMCYSAIGDNAAAVKIFQSILDNENKMGLLGYYQLGVIYFKEGDFDQAIACFNQQIDINDIAEAHYYLSQIFKRTGKYVAYTKEKDAAIALYKKHRHLDDPYTFHLNWVSLETILHG